MMMPDRQEPNGDPSEDERYDVAYIQRESVLILRYLKRGKRHIMRDLRVYPKEVDDRILKRWGLK